MLLHHFGSRDELMLAIVEEVELRPFERLFFECYSRGAQGEQPFAGMVPGAVDTWLERVAATADGTIEKPAAARLGLAVIRGLLLDLVATGDEVGVDVAARAFVEMVRETGS